MFEQWIESIRKIREQKKFALIFCTLTPLHARWSGEYLFLSGLLVSFPFRGFVPCRTYQWNSILKEWNNKLWVMQQNWSFLYLLFLIAFSRSKGTVLLEVRLKCWHSLWFHIEWKLTKRDWRKNNSRFFRFSFMERTLSSRNLLLILYLPFEDSPYRIIGKRNRVNILCAQTIMTAITITHFRVYNAEKSQFLDETFSTWNLASESISEMRVLTYVRNK